MPAGIMRTSRKIQEARNEIDCNLRDADKIPAWGALGRGAVA